MITFRTQQRNRQRIRRTLAMWTVNVTAMVVLAWVVVTSLFQTAQVTGRSMEPTLSNGQTVLVDTAVYRLRRPSRFDVILFSGPEGEGGETIKRIVGLPGETVRIAGGDVYINGVKTAMPLETTRCAVAGTAQEAVVLGENEYFVLGDWPEVSEDSRFSTVGNIPLSRIRGKVWFVAAPFLSFGAVR